MRRRATPHTLLNKSRLRLGNVKPSALKLALPWAGIAGVRTRDAGRIGMVVGNEILKGKAELAQITDTMRALRSGLAYRKRRQKQRREDSADGNDNQQFDERECRVVAVRRCLHTCLNTLAADLSRAFSKPLPCSDMPPPTSRCASQPQ